MTDTKHKEHITSEHFGIPADFSDRAENYAQWRVQELMAQLAEAQALKDAQVAQQAEQGWQPIETAPKDFVTSFDGWCGERVADITWAHPDYSAKGHYAFCISEYEQGFGHITEVKGLTHWMPLPAEPKGGV